MQAPNIFRNIPLLFAVSRTISQSLASAAVLLTETTQGGQREKHKIVRILIFLLYPTKCDKITMPSALLGKVVVILRAMLQLIY